MLKEGDESMFAKEVKEIFPWDPKTISSSNPAKLSNFLNGQWIESKKYKEIINPLSGEPFVLMPDTSEEELTPFIESLSQCPTHGLHNPLKNVERYVMYGRICAEAAMFLKSSTGRDYFARLIQIVMPKDMGQCYAEVDIVVPFLRNFSGDGVRFLAKGQTTPGDRLGQESIDYRWPYGPVAVITPFNFPLEIMALQLMGALFMGNKPIIKQSSTTSIVIEAFVRLLLHCGMPKDDMLLIHCSGSVMEKLVASPIVRLTQFTGGSDTAHKLLELTGGRCRIEDAGFDWKLMGPNVIPSMVDFVAMTCDRDAYAASGQKCSAQSMLIVHENWIKTGLLEKIKDLAAKRNLKDLTIGPVLSWDNQRIQKHIDELLRIDGAKLLFGGKPLSGHSIPPCYGAFEPTAIFVPLSQISSNFKTVATELFGPLQIITTWDSQDDLELILKIFEKLENRLTAAVVDNDPDFLNYVLGRTTNGTTYAGIKARTTAAPQNHFFGPTGHPACAGIGPPEAIINVWSQNRTIVMDTDSEKYNSS